EGKAADVRAKLAGLNGPAIEAHLLAAATKAIAAFARKHAGEVFDGFCFNCNAEAHGQVLFAFNTEERSNGNGRSEELRWSPGDWEYPQFGSLDEDKRWLAMMKPLGDECGIDRELADRLLDSIARVAHRLAETNAFSALRRTQDFIAFVIDHDETLRAVK